MVRKTRPASLSGPTHQTWKRPWPCSHLVTIWTLMIIKHVQQSNPCTPRKAISRTKSTICGHPSPQISSWGNLVKAFNCRWPSEGKSLDDWRTAHNLRSPMNPSLARRSCRIQKGETWRLLVPSWTTQRIKTGLLKPRSQRDRYQSTQNRTLWRHTSLSTTSINHRTIHAESKHSIT